MENLSRTVSKKACNGNVVSNGFVAAGKKTVYDDVFGGPPKFGVPTFSPRVEDYSEIFGGFHASRGSATIPVLDLPTVDEAEVCFDVRSSVFDYSEVFGGFHDCFDFAVSCEELFDQEANGGNESSEEAWTPAETESLSEKSAPSAYSGKSQSLSNGDSHQSFDGIEQLNISYHEANRRSKNDMPNGTHIIYDELNPSQMMEDRNVTLRVTDDINLNLDFIERDIGGKHLRKTMSHITNSTAGIDTLGKDIKSLRSYSQNNFHHNETFLSVAEISLRTHPSQLPPPSRPPPFRKGDSGGLASDLKGTNNYAFEGIAGDSSPPFFDVEVDASSSAAASAAAMKEAVEQAQAKLRSAKELMERKKEGLQSRSKLGSKSDIKDKKGMIAKMVDGSNNLTNDKRVRGTQVEEDHGMEFLVEEERQNVTKITLGVPYSVEGEEFFDVVEKSTQKRQGKEFCSSLESYKTEATAEWMEANDFFELVKTDKSRKIIEQANSGKIHVQYNKSQGRLHKEMKTAMTASEQQEEGSTIINPAGEACELEENEKKLKASEEARRQEHEKKVDVPPKINKLKEDEKNFKVAYEHREIKSNLAAVDVWNEYEVEIGVQPEENYLELEETIEHKENNQKLKVSNDIDIMVNDNRLKEVRERRENGKRLKETFEQEKTEQRLKQDLEKDEFEKRVKEVREQEAIEKKQEEAHEKEENERRLKEAFERKRLFELKENEKKQKEANQREENEKKLKEALERKEKERRLKEALEKEANDRKYKEACKREEYEMRRREDLERKEVEKRLREAFKQEENENRSVEAQKIQESEKIIEEMNEQEGTGERSKQCSTWEEGKKSIHDGFDGITLNGRHDVHEVIMGDENEKILKLAQGTRAQMETEILKEADGACKLDARKNLQADEHVENRVNSEAKQDISADEVRERINTERKDGESVVEAVEKVSVPIDDRFEASGRVQGDLKSEQIHISRLDAKKSVLDESVRKSGEAFICSGQTACEENIKEPQMAFDSKDMDEKLTHEWGERGKNIGQTPVAFKQGLNTDKFRSTHVVNEGIENGRKMGRAPSTTSEGKTTKISAQHVNTSQSTERKGKNANEDLKLEEERKEQRMKREKELEQDRLRKLQEDRERERERERDRMAVERATQEVRERAYAESRNKIERAAVERATAEARLRAMAEAREKMEKEGAEAREKSLAQKASMEARIRVERAAVERATAEARDRAVGAMTEKAALEARERAGRSASSSGSKYPYSSTNAGIGGESAQRCKARLERHQRTDERAAKALAEKNTRDLIAQREQAERNRLAESLDADVKRWSSGKEGNMRALLSTLQYILGPDSSWQPIPLTEVITAAAVKKAYRKATLCVHPDKLQQRGASIQQKYVCEKVFDLLKEAWNRFNSEER